MVFLLMMILAAYGTEPRKSVRLCGSHSLERPPSRYISPGQPWKSEAQLKLLSCQQLREYSGTLRTYAGNLVETEMNTLNNAATALEGQSSRFANPESFSPDQLRNFEQSFYRAVDSFNHAAYDEVENPNPEHLLARIRNRINNAFGEIESTHNCVLAVARSIEEPVCTWPASPYYRGFSNHIRTLNSPEVYSRNLNRIQTIQSRALSVSERLAREIESVQGPAESTNPTQSTQAR